MRNKTLLIVALCLVVLLVGGWTMQSKAQWEYKFEYNVTEKKANEMAAQGWEIVAVNQKNGVTETFVFKRAK